MFYLLFILMIPVLEVVVFIQAGGYLGVLNTLLLTILTAVIGMGLLKKQGFETLRNAQAKAEKGEAPLGEMFDGLCLFAAGLLLLTPGFVTDTVGFLLFLPPFRVLLRTWAKTLPVTYFHQSGFSGADMFRMQREEQQKSRTRTDKSRSDIIEGDYIDVTEDDESNPSR